MYIYRSPLRNEIITIFIYTKYTVRKEGLVFEMNSTMKFSRSNQREIEYIILIDTDIGLDKEREDTGFQREQGSGKSRRLYSPAALYCSE